MSAANDDTKMPEAPHHERMEFTPRDHGPGTEAGDRPPRREDAADSEVRRILDRLRDPALSDDDRRILLEDPEAQRVISSFGIFYELNTMRQLLEDFGRYLPSALIELRRQTVATEAMDTRQRSKNRWSMVWQVLWFLIGNLPALASLGMHVLGHLSRARTLLAVVVSLAVNILLFAVRFTLRWRHRRKAEEARTRS